MLERGPGRQIRVLAAPIYVLGDCVPPGRCDRLQVGAYQEVPKIQATASSQVFILCQTAKR